jgi:hypothetical protein
MPQMFVFIYQNLKFKSLNFRTTYLYWSYSHWHDLQLWSRILFICFGLGVYVLWFFTHVRLWGFELKTSNLPRSFLTTGPQNNSLWPSNWYISFVFILLNIVMHIWDPKWNHMKNIWIGEWDFFEYYKFF